MKDLFYLEIRNCCEEIRKMDQEASNEEIEKRNLRILKIIDEIAYLSHIGRKEGLLALESECYKMDETDKKYLKTMIMLVVDGTDPELIEEICLMRYMASGFKGYEALIYMLQMFGVLAIQAGENPRVIEEKLLAMVPESVCDMFRHREEEKIKSSFLQKVEDIDMSKVEKLYEGELNRDVVNAGYPEVEKLDCLVKVISDRALQRALREIYNADLELAMKGLSGEGRHRIFSNMSKRLCVMIAEDLEDMGRGRKCDIGEAARRIYDIFMRLMECYEIYPEESDEVYALYVEYHTGSNDEEDVVERVDVNDIDDMNGTLSLDEMIKLMGGNGNK